MGIFNRQTMEQITQKMIDWSRGVTNQLTDWRVGSKNRTIYEAVAIVIEDLYDKTYKAVKTAVLQNLYTALGFAPFPAINATGIVRFYAQSGPSPTQPFVIPMGTQVQASPTPSSAPITFQTTQDASIVYNSSVETGTVTINGVSMTGWFYVDVPVVCVQAGIVGKVSSGTVQTLVGAPSGVGACNNPAAVTTGQDAETLSQQKARFQLFFTSRTRGTIDSILSAAETAQVLDSTGSFVQERTVSAVVVDGNGTFDVYLWNGVGTASSALIANAVQIITGYTGADGNRVYGYKPAGVTFHVHSVTVQNVPLAFTITPLNGYGLTDADVTAGLIDLRTPITNAVSSYFATLTPGQTVVQAAIEAVIKQVQGVYDVQITAPNGNVTATQTSMLVPQLPITFTKGTTV